MYRINLDFILPIVDRLVSNSDLLPLGKNHNNLMITRNLLELLSDKCEVVRPVYMLNALTDCSPTTDNAQTKQVERLCFAVQLRVYCEK